jgi:hypothetical protein
MVSRICLALALLALVACGGDSGGDSGEAAVEQFGYIRSVDASSDPATLEFDQADWLSGEAAQEAAEADGAIEPGAAVPNDYYVRNHDKSTRRLEIGADAEITASRCQLCRGGKPGTLEDFLASFSRTGQTYADDYRGAESQYWLTIEDGRVLAIDEQYRP